MSATPLGPRTLRAGLIVMDPDGRAVRRVVGFQFNPDMLTRSLSPQGAADGAGGDGLRLKGAAVETLRFEATMDAADRLERPDENTAAVQNGLLPDLALLETLVNPSAAQLQASDALAAQGALEILPPLGPLVLLAWGRARVLAVRITELTITEEAFDAALNPIRAKVAMGLRVLTPGDLAPQAKGTQLFLAHLQRLEGLAQSAPRTTLPSLGLTGIP